MGEGSLGRLYREGEILGIGLILVGYEVDHVVEHS